MSAGNVGSLKFKTPLLPFLPILGLILNCLVLISLAFDPEQRVALYCGVPFVAACHLIYHLRIKKHREQDVAAKTGNSIDYRRKNDDISFFVNAGFFTGVFASLGF